MRALVGAECEAHRALLRDSCEVPSVTDIAVCVPPWEPFSTWDRARVRLTPADSAPAPSVYATKIGERSGSSPRRRASEGSARCSRPCPCMRSARDRRAIRGRRNRLCLCTRFYPCSNRVVARLGRVRSSPPLAGVPHSRFRARASRSEFGRAYPFGWWASAPCHNQLARRARARKRRRATSAADPS